MAAGAATTPMSPQQQAQQATMIDQQAVRSILKNALPRKQVVQGQQTFFPASTPVLNVNPLAIGLLKRFTVKVTATITNTGNQTLTLSDTGSANLLSQVLYTDLNGYTRINTTGLHLTLVANAKRRRPMAVTFQDNQVGAVTATQRSQVLNAAPASWPVFQAPATIAEDGSGVLQAYYEVPISYSDTDLRGAIWTGVLQGVQQLNFTPNPNAVVANPGDDTFAVYTGPAGAAGSITSMTIQVVQEYFDQLPTYKGSYLLPNLSMSKAYLLLNTPYTGMSQNQDFAISYANYREFLSTYAIYNSTGASGGRTYGTDIVYWGLQSANSMFQWQYDPITATMYANEELQTALPAGCYYFSTRQRNIKTSQFGNMQLVLNAGVASASSKAQVMVEMFADLATLVGGSGINQQ
jgi:hypothetical protein